MTSSAQNRQNGFRREGVLPRRAPAWVLLAAALALPGCETLTQTTSALTGGGPAEGQPGFVNGFLGGVATDDPAAALAARQVLSAGGSATDAAVAAGFVMAVTLPSRTGLGGGGACVVYDRLKPAPEAVMFLPGGRATTPAGADRPAAVPLLARGLFGLYTRNPVRPLEELLAPAERLARFGTEMSRGLAADLAAVAGPLLVDPGARAVFADPAGGPKQQGDRLVQLELAQTLGQLRTNGVGDLHQGALARRLEEGSAQIGGTLSTAELRAGLPNLVPPLDIASAGGDRIAFLPAPADGGLAAAVAFTALQGGATPADASNRGLAAASAWRQQGGDPRALLTATGLPPAQLGPLPASTALVVYDRRGGAVACAFTMNNLFGTGRMVPGLGFLLAPAPGVGQVRPPLLSAAIAYNTNVRGFRMAIAASGQQAAPIGVAGPAALHLLRGAAPLAALQTGALAPARSQLGACTSYLPGAENRCVTLSDPRGAGVALGAVDR